MTTRLRVAVDARKLQERPLGGVGRLLFHQLPLAAQHVDLVLLTERKRAAPELDLPTVALGADRAVPGLVWLQTSARRWLRSFNGVFHGAFNAVPFRCPVPSIVSLYDLSFELGEVAMSPMKRALWRTYGRHAAHASSVVVTISASVVDELGRFYGIDPTKIVVAPPAADPVFSPARADHGRELAATAGLAPRFVATLGGTPRRQLEVAVAAFDAARTALGLSGRELGLAVVGPEAPLPREGVAHLGALDDRDWASVLAAADAFLYATRYEGFGMPALEALASNTPVVAARVGPLPEVLGAAASWAERPDVPSLTAALATTLAEPDGRVRTASARAQQLASRPTWDVSARALVGAYERAGSWRPA